MKTEDTKFRGSFVTWAVIGMTAVILLGPVSVLAQTNAVPDSPRTALPPLEWISVGFGGGGAVQDIVSAPSLPDRMYACVDVGGLYRSDDGGRHWRPIYATLSRLENHATRPYILGVSHQDPDVFYLVTEIGPFTSRDGGHTYRRIGQPVFETYNSQTLCINPFDDRDCVFFFHKQVLRTRDGGVTVAPLPLPPELGKKPDACQVFFPGQGSEPVIVIGNGREGKWFRSMDGGANWVAMKMAGWPGGPPTYGFEGHFATLFVSFDKSADKPLLTMASLKNPEHAYRSDDLGDHWHELPMPTTTPILRSNQLMVFPHPTDPATYAVTHNPSPNHITFDGGKTWTPMRGIVGESGFDHDNGGSAGGRFIQVNRVHFPLGARERVYAVNLMDIQRSDDNGRNFAIVSSRVLSRPHHFMSTGPHIMSSGIEGAYIHVYVGDPNSGYRYISDDDSAIHRSEDFCRTWYDLQKVVVEPKDSGHYKASQRIWHIAACATILIDPAYNPSRIYAWFNNNITVLPSELTGSFKNGRLYTKAKVNPFRIGFYVSANHGEDFLPCSSYQSFPYKWAALTDAGVMDPRSPKEKRTFWIAVASGVFRSDDGGREWVCLNDRIAKSFGAQLPHYDDVDAWDAQQWAFARVRLDPQDSQVVYAHLMRRRGKVDQPLAPIIRSTDGGETWQAVESPVKSCPAFEISPLDPQRLYAADENQGMFVSTDRGKTWEPRGLALGSDRNVHDPIRKEWIVRIWPSRRHRDLVFVGVDSIFASRPRAGVFRSADNGRTWLDVTGDIPHLRIMNVKEDDLDPRWIYAGTMGGGGFLAFDRLPMPEDEK